MAIRKYIKAGAHDTESVWFSALELVHRAYKEENVERPTPALKDSWDQYEDNISFAVTQLQDASNKGIRDESWKQTTANTKFFGY
jgi:hypothetical protein